MYSLLNYYLLELQLFLWAFKRIIIINIYYNSNNGEKWRYSGLMLHENWTDYLILPNQKNYIKLILVCTDSARYVSLSPIPDIDNYIRVNVGDKVTCSAEGYPEPEYRWTMDGDTRIYVGKDLTVQPYMVRINYGLFLLGRIVNTLRSDKQDLTTYQCVFIKHFSNCSVRKF